MSLQNDHTCSDLRTFFKHLDDSSVYRTNLASFVVLLFDYFSPLLLLVAWELVGTTRYVLVPMVFYIFYGSIMSYGHFMAILTYYTTLAWFKGVEAVGLSHPWIITHETALVQPTEWLSLSYLPQMIISLITVNILMDKILNNRLAGLELSDVWKGSQGFGTLLGLWLFPCNLHEAGWSLVQLLCVIFLVQQIVHGNIINTLLQDFMIRLLIVTPRIIGLEFLLYKIYCIAQEDTEIRDKVIKVGTTFKDLTNMERDAVMTEAMATITPALKNEFMSFLTGLYQVRHGKSTDGKYLIVNVGLLEIHERTPPVWVDPGLGQEPGQVPDPGSGPLSFATFILIYNNANGQLQYYPYVYDLATKVSCQVCGQERIVVKFHSSLTERQAIKCLRCYGQEQFAQFQIDKDYWDELFITPSQYIQNQST